MKRETDIYLKGFKGALYITIGMLCIVLFIVIINILING